MLSKIKISSDYPFEFLTTTGPESWQYPFSYFDRMLPYKIHILSNIRIIFYQKKIRNKKEIIYIVLF